MRLFLAVLFLMLWWAPAMAQQGVDSLCARLSRHVSIDGVEFQPDAAAVPADLNAIAEPVAGSISIPVDVNLADYFDRPELRSVPGLLLEPEIANVEINQDGSVFYNGQEVSADIQRVCGSGGDAAVVAPPPAPKAAPPVKPRPKPKKPIKVPEKVSSVRVFNGPRTVISDVPAQDIKTEVEKTLKKEAEKPEVIDENAIDVEDLKAQDIKDGAINGNNAKDSILEGQYP